MQAAPEADGREALNLRAARVLLPERDQEPRLLVFLPVRHGVAEVAGKLEVRDLARHAHPVREGVGLRRRGQLQLLDVQQENLDNIQAACQTRVEQDAQHNTEITDIGAV